MIKKIIDFFLIKYSKESLEIKKKSLILFYILFIISICAITGISIEIIFRMPLISLLPMTLGLIFVIPTIILLKFGKYNAAVTFFEIGCILVVTSLPISDRYDKVFELYRYSFLLLFFFITVSLIVYKRTQLIIMMILGIIGITFVYLYKFYYQMNLLTDKVVIMTYVFCVIMYSMAGVITLLLLSLTKRIIRVAVHNAKLAKIQRNAYSRFVPQQLLKYLKKKSIIDVQVGDHLQKEMTIMFSDIRDFTNFSETLSPTDSFRFLNSYLSKMEPYIHSNNGFIDKYVGDSIIALFPESPDNALKCSIGMLKALNEYNLLRKKIGWRTIKIGIGINTGSLMIGTIGSKNRMDGTVISDAVNIASRIEGLTKIYHSSILISQETFSRLQDPTLYNYRFLDSVRVPGKEKSISVFEIIDGLPDDIFDSRLSTKDLFEKGIFSYIKKDIEKAFKIFKKIYVETNKLDEAALIYLKRCKYLLKNGIPEDWDGIALIDTK